MSKKDEDQLDRAEDDEGVSVQQKEQQKKEEAQTFYDINPIKATCPQCFVEITTFVRHEMNALFPLSVLITLLVFGYLSLVICPVVYLLT